MNVHKGADVDEKFFHHFLHVFRRSEENLSTIKHINKMDHHLTATLESRHRWQERHVWKQEKTMSFHNTKNAQWEKQALQKQFSCPKRLPQLPLPNVQRFHLHQNRPKGNDEIFE